MVISKPVLKYKIETTDINLLQLLLMQQMANGISPIILINCVIINIKLHNSTISNISTHVGMMGIAHNGKHTYFATMYIYKCG